MEPKPQPAAHGDGAPAEAPRRRGGGGKRKASGSSFTPSKRHAKERNAAFHAPSHMLHSGPLTRAARQSPHKLSTAPADAAPAASVPGGSGPGEGAAIRPDEVQTPAEETPLVDEGFEAVRSRGAGVHVVPTFAGWFSWKEIHQVEKQTLPSFFNGKSEKRTPEIYSGIRNSIMMKFHANPQLQLEPKDLAELSVGEVDARQEVFDFLDHWGLINFHPFPPAGLEESKPEESQSDSHNEEKASLIEKLFKFEPVQSYMIPLPNKGEGEIPVPLPTLLPDPVLVEDVIAAAEPSVEYHCNSCSVDCSGKRYHCRTQADFDLCSNCYNEAKFDAGMSKTDFILMDSTEVSGARGTSWTDEETLLLLEALEIFGGKWTEIAEHVATKTKTQCMLHFLQMQIEDRFHDGDDIHQNIHESTEQALVEKGTPEVPEKMETEEKVEGKDTKDEKPSEKTEGNHTEEKTEEGSVVENKDAKNSGGADSVTIPNVDEPKPSSDTDLAKENSVNLDTSEKNVPDDAIDISGENASNDAIDILKSAFEAAGNFPGHEGSFADAGNPVMALAAFLAGLVEDDSATTSCCSSLKAISEDSPALQLASRHCYILEDPPSDLKDIFVTVSNTNKDEDQAKGEDQAKDEDMVIDSTGNEKKDINVKEDNTVSVEKQNSPSISPKDHKESDTKNVSCDDEAPTVEPKSNKAKETDDPIPLVDKSASNDTKVPSSSTKDSVAPENNANGCGLSASQEVVAGSTTCATNPELLKDKPSSEVEPDDDSPSQCKIELNKTEDAVAAPTAVQEDEKTHTLRNGRLEEPNSAENVPADGEMVSRVTAEHNDSLTRLKRAAATAVSAAAAKAKLLAEQEEDQIRRLAALVVEKLLQKTEAKMSLFADVEHVALRTREYTEKTRKKLLMERNAIIAARMGALPSRPNQQGAAGNRLPPGYGAPAVRPPNAMPRPSS
ncbi:SWI/SNF complex subunit SWI3D-like [Triticum dicoccoides]|uniref:SWI/SNF complex subunit SWI3D-like n=1 Tax=Triticum dicoccoides TaxID=85692 RepID=UPI000E7C99B4|nr:SWI/SNF complex subunit SWI3D-like [Triticum dicoccoides]